MSDPLDAIRDILYPDHTARVTPINDDVQAHGDDLRDALHWETLIDSSLIVKDPPPADWRPRDEDLC